MKNPNYDPGEPFVGGIFLRFLPLLGWKEMIESWHEKAWSVFSVYLFGNLLLGLLNVIVICLNFFLVCAGIFFLVLLVWGWFGLIPLL